MIIIIYSMTIKYIVHGCYNALNMIVMILLNIVNVMYCIIVNI